MPIYKIKHITRYNYNKPALEGINQIMLYPIHDQYQNILKQDITITKDPFVEIFTDYFGNRLGVFSIIEPHNELTIASEAEIITSEISLPQDDRPAAEQRDQLVVMADQFPYIDFLHQDAFENQEEVWRLIDTLYDTNKTPYQNAQIFSGYIYKNFEYSKGITNVETKVSEIWRLKAGVCQDFAHMLLTMLKKINVPARYVSGYICPKNHEFRGEGATHAWVEAYIPDYGWVGLDPTNNCVVNDRHIRLAVGRSFYDCTPVKGTYKGSSDHILEVLVLIDNNTNISPVEVENASPVFTYKTVQEATTHSNSYRQYMEQMQQQQQQQQ